MLTFSWIFIRVYHDPGINGSLTEVVK